MTSQLIEMLFDESNVNRDENMYLPVVAMEQLYPVSYEYVYLPTVRLELQVTLRVNKSSRYILIEPIA